VAAPAVEAAPIGALLGASLIVICAWLTLVGLSKAYDYTLGALLHTLAEVLDFKVWRFAVHLGAPFDALDHKVRDAIGAGITQLEATIGRLFHGLEYLVRLQWDTLAGFAHDVEQAITGLTHANVPAIVKHITNVTVKPVKEHVGVTVAKLHALEHKVYRGIDELQRDVQHAFEQAYHGIDELTRRLTHDVVPAIHGLQAELHDVVGYTRKNLRLRITRLEAAVFGGAVAGVALATLTRYFPWWQCTNVRAFNRLLCRAPIGAMDDLFGFLLAAGAIAEFRTLVKLAQGVAGETTEGLHALLRVTE